jgi:ribosomal protein L7Ae-like RNA K-turn-binding protein
MNKEKVLGKLGLASRARKLSFGEGLILKSFSKDQTQMVFLASDAGKNITKKMHQKQFAYGFHLMERFSTEDLSKAVGKEHVKAILLRDEGFIKTILDEL